jgi:hypothetical protein
MAHYVKIGPTTVQLTGDQQNLDAEGVRTLLRGGYPEIVHATARTREEKDAAGNPMSVIDFLPQPGRKG